MTGIVIPDGGTIGSASDTDAISIASDGQVTIAQNNPTLTLGSNATFPANHIVGVQEAIATDSSSTDYEFSASTTTSNVASVTLGTDYSTSVLSSASNKLIVTVSFYAYMPASNASGDHWRIILTGNGISNYNNGGYPMNNDYGYQRTGYWKTNLSATILVTPGQNNPTYGLKLILAGGSTAVYVAFVQWNFMEVQV